MKFNFKKLKKDIEWATKKAFQDMVDQHQAERIYAFALYSDEGAMTVCPATNTLDFLATQPKNDLTYYKFESVEWNYEGDGADDEFSTICNTLFDEVEAEKYEDDEALFEEFQIKLYQTCYDVLLKLKKEDFFKNILGYDIFLIFNVTDFEFDTDFLIQMITELNDNDYRDEYLNWMKTWKK